MREIKQEADVAITLSLGERDFADYESWRKAGLKAGANVIMPDFTPQNYSQNYAIYNNKARVTLDLTRRLISKAGRNIGKGKGGSLKCKKTKELKFHKSTRRFIKVIMIKYSQKK